MYFITKYCSTYNANYENIVFTSFFHCSISGHLLRAAPDAALAHHDRPEPLGDGRQDGPTAATETNATTSGNKILLNFPPKTLCHMWDLNTRQAPLISDIWEWDLNTT